MRLRYVIALVVVALVVFQWTAVRSLVRRNIAVIEYVRSRPADEPPFGPADTRLLARFDAAAADDPSIARLPQYRLLRQLRALEPADLPEACHDGSHPWLLTQALNRARRWRVANPADAERVYRWAREACPGSFEVLEEWGRLRRIHRDLPGAAAFYREALTRQPAVPPSQHIDKPAEWWRRLVIANAQGDYASVLLGMGEAGQAVELIERAQDISPEPPSPSSLQLLGIAYYRVGRFDDASATLSAALARDPSLEDARRHLERLKSR